MTTEVTARVAAFDRLRGLIIVLMAVDHASYFIARVHPMESWAVPPPYYGDVAAFLTRWLTHLCAPGFFLLMGIGIVYFGESRRAAGWTDGRITRFLATRGAALLVVQHFLENPAWLLGVFSVDPGVEAAMPVVPGAGGELMLGFAVLSALGVAMIVGSVVWRAPLVLHLVLIVAAMWATRLFTPGIEASVSEFPVWRVLLWTPARTGIMQNLYPWVIWLVPASLGIVLGRRWVREPGSIGPTAAGLGLVFLLVFVVARVSDIGDAHTVTPGVIGWLTVTKYPPGAAFFAVMLGLNLIGLAALARWPARWLAPLEVYGRAPFFFYLAHLWALGALSWLFPEGTSLPVMYAVWAVVVAGLYPACAWYARVKFSKSPTSLWRLF